MSSCKDCIHEELCNYEDEQSGGVSPYFPNNKCRWFKNKADLVEVVRCKDCKHFDSTQYFGEKIKYCQMHTNSAEDDFCRMEDNDFCSYGERK